MQWRRVPNEHYSISENGDVRNDVTGKTLRERIDNKGYHKCNLYDGKGKSKGFLVHRLVAFLFIGLPGKDQTQVNHIDGNPLNNHHSNLEWCTPKENTHHAVKTGLFPRGETHHLSKVKDDQIQEIRRLYSTGEYSQYELATLFNVNQSEISRYVNFKRRGGKCA